MGGFDGEFGGRVGGASWASDEAVCVRWCLVGEGSLGWAAWVEVIKGKEAYPAPLLIRTILPERRARIDGSIARTARRGP